MKKRLHRLLSGILIFVMVLQMSIPMNVSAASMDNLSGMESRTEESSSTAAENDKLSEETEQTAEGTREIPEDPDASKVPEVSGTADVTDGNMQETPVEVPGSILQDVNSTEDEFTIEHVATGKLVKTYKADGTALTVDGAAGDAGTVFARAVFGICDNNTLSNPALMVASLVSKDYNKGIATVAWNNGAQATVVKVNGSTAGSGWESIQILPNGDGTISFKDSYFDAYITVEDADGVPVLKCMSDKTKESLTDNEKFIIHSVKVPAQVDNLAINASTRTRTTLDLTWSRPACIYTNVQLLQKGPGEADFTKIADLAEETSYQVTGLEPGTSYTFKLRFVNGNGNAEDITYSSESNEAVASTRLGEKPAAPVNLSVKETEDQKLELSWDEVENAVQYRVLRAESMFGTYAEVAVVKEAHAEISYTGNKYANYYRVIALNGDTEEAEASDESAYVSLETELFGDHTLVFAPTDDPAKIDKTLTALFAKTHDSSADAQFKGEHWQIYFKPGDYTQTKCINLGFYTAINGLGETPYDVRLNNVAIPDYLGNNNATCNFWRSMENVSIINTGNEQGKAQNSWRADWFNWGVAQAAPLRRVYSERPVAYDWNYGWASGGYVADCYFKGIDGEGNTAGTWSGQQFYTRNTVAEGNVFGTTLNNFFQGVIAPNLPNAEAVAGGQANALLSRQGYSNWKILDNDGNPKVFTNVEETKKIAEKPFLYLDENGEYMVFVPAVRENTKGTSWSEDNMGEGKSVSLDTFYIASPADSAAVLNEQLAAGKNIYFTPGIYHAEETIKVTKADTILLGTGLATIIPDNEDAAMRISDVDGVRIAGIIFDAGKHSEYLLVVGEQSEGSAHAADPTVLQDLFFRVGGTTDELTKADNALEINSNDVIGDHFWIWRADHGAGVAWYGNESKHGLIVNGDDVTCYALFNEHFQDYNTLWNGENGATFFYQNETAYDPISQEAWMSHDGTVNGYASYKVADDVKNHYAIGLGVYNVFIYTGPTYDATEVQIELDNAIEVPDTPGVMIENACLQTFADETKALQKINSVVNGMGDPVSSGTDAITGEKGTAWDRSFLRYYCNGEADGSCRELRNAKQDLKKEYDDIKQKLGEVTDPEKKEALEKKLAEIEKALDGYEATVTWPVSQETKDRIDSYKKLSEELKDTFDRKPAPTDKTGLWAENIEDIAYTGAAIKPVVTVYDGNTLLKLNKDYKVAYKNNKKVGEATVTITGKGNYQGSVTKHFNIVPKDLSDADIVADDLCVNAPKNSKAVKATPVVTRDGKKLKLKTDYTVEYPDHSEGAYVNPGTYRILIQAAKNSGYTGSKEITLTIVNKEQLLISDTTIGKIADMKYDGRAKRPALTVKYKKALLTPGEDYTVRYQNNKEVGTATVIIVGTGEKYVGKKTVTFKITGAALKANMVTGVPASVEYNGAKQTPDVEVKGLTKGKDYKVTYVNNMAAGKATVVVTGINGYTGTVKKTFTILPFDLSKNTEDRFQILSKDITAAYEKNGSKPSAEVAFNGIPMTENVDYTLTYKNNNKAGDTQKAPQLIIKGKGNFKGTAAPVAFTITKQDLGTLQASAADLPVKNVKKYNKTIPVIVDLNGKTLKNGVDFMVTGYTYADGSEITSVPEAGAVIKVTAEGKGNYEKSITAQFRILANDKNIAAAKVTVKEQTYTGKELKPAGEEVKVQVKVKEGKKTVWKDLQEGTDYEIVADSYTKNIQNGTGKLTIRGLGEYGGTKVVTFKIKAQKLNWADWYREMASWFDKLF